MRAKKIIDTKKNELVLELSIGAASELSYFVLVKTEHDGLSLKTLFIKHQVGLIVL